MRFRGPASTPSCHADSDLVVIGRYAGETAAQVNGQETQVGVVAVSEVLRGEPAPQNDEDDTAEKA